MNGRTRSEHLDRRGFGLGALALGGLAPAAALAASPDKPLSRAAPPANASVMRACAGAYAYRRSADGALRGAETFQLSVHPDGTRTMRAFTDIAARDVQVNVVLRADTRLRPIEAYVSEYTQGRFKGAALMRVGADGVTVDVDAPVGAGRTTLPAPEHLSLLTHPVALDGWHSWYAERTPDVVQKGAVAMVQGDADAAAAFAVRMIPLTFRFRGAETVRTRAGRFDADHFTLGEDIDVWVHGPDRILVRYVNAREGREYELMRLTQTTGRLVDTSSFKGA